MVHMIVKGREGERSVSIPVKTAAKWNVKGGTVRGPIGHARTLGRDTLAGVDDQLWMDLVQTLELREIPSAFVLYRFTFHLRCKYSSPCCKLDVHSSIIFSQHRRLRLKDVLVIQGECEGVGTLVPLALGCSVRAAL